MYIKFIIMRFSFVFILLWLAFACQWLRADAPESQKIVNADARFDHYLSMLRGRRVGLLVNHTSLVGGRHLCDTLMALGIDVRLIFAPEHGFRGTAAAGEHVSSGTDAATGLPVHSLYGRTRRPTPAQMSEVDVVVFDIQDVGARFYTYISTMHYMMEACAEAGVHFMVLDRPNPNGHYVDGPVLRPAFASFVGMHPIPVVHGLTVGELALMINGEGWLRGGGRCRLTVIPVGGYRHSMPVEIGVAPSPNLPNAQAVRLYPSLCFFEGTHVSVGRGTPFPFQVVGAPGSRFGTFTFTPQSIAGKAVNPPCCGRLCSGLDLRRADTPACLDLSLLVDFYRLSGGSDAFFADRRFFDLLAGTDSLRLQIEAGRTAEQIRASWRDELGAYMSLRQKYLIYE